MRKWWGYAEVYMVYGEHGNKIWWNLGGDVEVVQTFFEAGSSGQDGGSGVRRFRGRPESPGPGMFGLDRKFRWSGFCQEQRLGDRGFGRKNLGEKPKSEGEKEEIV